MPSGVFSYAIMIIYFTSIVRRYRISSMEGMG